MTAAPGLNPYEVGYRCGTEIAHSRSDSVEDLLAAATVIQGRIQCHSRQMSEEEHESTWGILDALADAQRLLNGIEHARPLSL
jgi:hypothetical protein